MSELKNVIWATVTVLIILLINWGVVEFLDAAFIEYSFLVGLIVTAIIRFFSSSGGFTSNKVRVMVQAQTGMKVDEEERRFNPTVVFYTAAGYTIVALLVTLFYYKDYIIG